MAAANDSDQALLHGALIAVGALGVADNVIFHWVLGWHRLNEAWTGTQNLVAESAVVAISAAMVAAGMRRERQRRLRLRRRLPPT